MSMMHAFSMRFYICIAVHGLFIIVKIGIDLEQHRTRIGCARITKVNPSQGKCHRGENFLTLDFYLMAFYLCILVYLLPILLRLHVCVPSSLKLNNKLSGYFIVRSKLIYMNNLNFLCILLFISNMTKVRNLCKVSSILRLNLAHSLACICLPMSVFNHSTILCYLFAHYFKIYCDIIFHKISNVIVKSFSIPYSIASLLLFLIILANVSLLNPGPEKLQALNCFFFQNVQGFVTLNSISKPFPDLCITKILEFQAYVFENAPDIIILNETWL